MPIDVHNLMAVLRGRALDRLEAGVHRGADLMVQHLKMVVAGEDPSHQRGLANVTPFLYVEPTGRVRSRRKFIEQWKMVTQFTRLGPPHSTGAGRDSIGYQIKEKNYEEGKIVVRIGVNANAPGGMTTLRSYMMGHELGIRYPTNPNSKAPKHVIQRPWLRVTLNRYWSEFAATVLLTSRGLM